MESLGLHNVNTKEEYFVARVRMLVPKYEPMVKQCNDAAKVKVEEADLTPIGLVTTILGAKKPSECSFAMSRATLDEYSGRLLSMSLRLIAPLNNTNERVALRNAPEVLTVLAGESGSGKTTLMLASGHGLYFTSKDLTGLPEKTLNAVDDTQKAARNKRVAQFLTSKIVSKLRDVVPALKSYDGDLDLLIALDEMVQRPNLVRGLCAVRSRIITNVNAELGLDAKSFIKLTFVVAGTGMDAQAAQPGGLPDTYRVLTMPASEEMPRHLVACVESLGTRPHDHIACAIERSPEAHELTKNPRFAAALLSMIRSLRVSFIGSPRSAEALLRFLLQGAAATYKSLNSMNLESVDDVRRIYQSAMQLVFRRRGFTPRVPDEVMLTLVGRFGVLKDRARWFKADKVPDDYEAVSSDEAHVLAAPPFRFEMSSAQQLLFRMHYGVEALPDAMWWAGYELVIANYLEAAALGCRGSTLEHMLRCLNDKSAWLATDKGKKLLSKPLKYKGVVVLRRNVQISSDTSVEELEDVRVHVCKVRAVIVVRGSSYADVIMIIPKTAVLLVQCKFYSETASHGSAEISAELTKLKNETASRLCDVAKCPRDSVISVIATMPTESKQKTNKEKEGNVVCENECVMWRTSADGSLAPLVMVLWSERQSIPLSETVAQHEIAEYKD